MGRQQLWASAISSPTQLHACLCVLGVPLASAQLSLCNLGWWSGWERAGAAFSLWWFCFVAVASAFVVLADSASSGWGPFCQCWLWVGVSPFAPRLSHRPPPLFHRGQRSPWGLGDWWWGLRVIWETLTFLCALVQNSPLLLHLLTLFFPSSNGAPPPLSPEETLPPPVCWPQGSGSDLGFGCETKWPKPAPMSPKQTTQQSIERDKRNISTLSKL